ncbi:unknown [Bacteroides intestinalis CAG:315]|nr:unknown [Bacteroides intestinalis CAG:315]
MFQGFYFRPAETELQCGGDGGYQFLVLPGFGNEICGTLFNGLHSLLCICIGCDKDNDRFCIQFQYLFQPMKAFFATDSILTEIHVEQDNIETGT